MRERVLYFRLMFWGVVFALLIGAGGWAASAYEYEMLDWMQANQERIQEWIARWPLRGTVAFTCLFALVLGLYIPGGVVLMLLVGAIFPTWQAHMVANLGNLAGATIGFLLARYLLRDAVQENYGQRLHSINEGIRQHGWIYLLILRIAPVLPAPVVNLGMGLTPMPLGIYMLVTLVGRIPMTALYVHMGTQLTDITRLSDLLSVEIIGALVLVSALILAAHYAMRRYGTI